MPFVKRLIGEDGFFSRGTLGTTVVADGSTVKIAKGAWVKIVTKASAGSIFGDLAVGQFYYAPIEMTPEYVGVADLDSWQVLTLERFIDGVSWSVEIAADEIETSVCADKFKQYRSGKLDASGNASFIYIAGETDKAGNLANKFFDIINIDATGVVTVNAANRDKIYLVGYLNEGKEVVDENYTIATIMTVELFNFSLPSNMGEPGNIDVPFRLVDGSDPKLYVIELPTA